jgi:hypothetical protein
MLADETKESMQNLNVALPDKEDFKAWFKEIWKEVKPEFMHELIKEARQEEPKVKYYTREEICNILHITGPTLKKRERDGMPATVIGKRKLYNLEAVEKFLKEKSYK